MTNLPPILLLSPNPFTLYIPNSPLNPKHSESMPQARNTLHIPLPKINSHKSILISTHLKWSSTISTKISTTSWTAITGPVSFKTYVMAKVLPIILSVSIQTKLILFLAPPHSSLILCHKFYSPKSPLKSLKKNQKHLYSLTKITQISFTFLI
jgi:hypothetical protein